MKTHKGAKEETRESNIKALKKYSTGGDGFCPYLHTMQEDIEIRHGSTTHLYPAGTKLCFNPERSGLVYSKSVLCDLQESPQRFQPKRIDGEVSCTGGYRFRLTMVSDPKN